MFIRSLLIAATTLSGLTLVQAQQPPKDRDTAPQNFAFSFDGSGGYLGVQAVEVTKENFGKYGLKEVRGVAVDKVLDNSPAAAAGSPRSSSSTPASAARSARMTARNRVCSTASATDAIATARSSGVRRCWAGPWWS